MGAGVRRVRTPVTVEEAKRRLVEYRGKNGPGPHSASSLASIIWPDARFITSQGAGAAASRVLKRLGCYWRSVEAPLQWGWIISFPYSKLQ